MDRRSRSNDGNVGSSNAATGTSADDGTEGHGERQLQRHQHHGGEARSEGRAATGPDTPASGLNSAAAAAPAPTSPFRTARYIRSRVANACDGCKARKVRCDGRMPCGYCADRQRAGSCRYSPQRRRQHPNRRRQGRQPQDDEQEQLQQQQQQQSCRPQDDPSTQSQARARQQSPLPQRQPPPSSPPQRTPAALGPGGAISSGPAERRAGSGTRGGSLHLDDARGDGIPDAAPAPRSLPPPHPPSSSPPSTRGTTMTTASTTTTNAAGAGEHSATEDEADVPREARLLCDAHGKLVFIGDCAPLSFFQSVRQLVTSRVGQSAFAPESSRYSVLENAASSSWAAAASAGPHDHGAATGGGGIGGPPEVHPPDVSGAVSAYLTMTTGLVDLFDRERLAEDLVLWANLERRRDTARASDDAASVVNYLVLAIGRLLDDPDDVSRAYFEHARDAAFRSLCGSGASSLGVGTVQAFALVTVYMLCSCQLSGAFLFFGVAVRAAYSIGVHRAEVNARFGPDARRQRDRLWKSLRVVDLYLSTSMGRPPATSDVDCTVSYRGGEASTAAGGHRAQPDLLDASVQILLITECVVLEVYSRRKISLQLTEGISRQLRDWSVRWLPLLKDIMAGRDTPSAAASSSPPSAGGGGGAQAVGACQVLASYYYAVMLVSRPFLMYELCRRLSDCSSSSAPRRPPAVTPAAVSGKSKLADACIDAASLMVDSILDLIGKGLLNVRVPLMVSWLFASSLVLGVGLLGGFGRILEKYSRMSIQCLDHFAKTDGHAAQYSLIAQSLLATALEHLERQELEERLRRTESSSQLFGLLMPPPPPPPTSTSHYAATPSAPTSHESALHLSARDAHSAASSPVPSASTRLGTRGVASPASTPSFIPPSYPLSRTRDLPGGGAAAFDRDKGRASYWDHHHGMGGMGLGGDGGAAGLLGLTESLLQAPDGDLWSAGDVLGIEGDAGSALNLFPLLEAGGGIDLAHYF